MVLRLTIEPDGSVSMCVLPRPDMKRTGARRRRSSSASQTFDFGAKEGIVAFTILYPIDFLPAA